MSGGNVLISILEILAVTVIALGFVFEPAVALWEKKTLRKIRRMIRRRRRRAEALRYVRPAFSPAVQRYARRRL